MLFSEGVAIREPKAVYAQLLAVGHSLNNEELRRVDLGE